MAITATEAASIDRRLRPAMMRLFDSLRQYVRVYTRTPNEIVPEHDIVWETHIGHGPERTLLDAIKMAPEMWAEAVPSECCIVHRETLKKYVGADAAEYMAGHGQAAVESQAARLRHEADLRDRRR